jgi:hypothetical protein
MKLTKFNPENKTSLTYGECLEPAMEIKDQKDADQYKADYIKYTEGFLINGVSEHGETAEQIVNANLGYFAGYYSDETRKRVEKLFCCSHPIFGSISQNGRPSSEEAFECCKKRKTLKEIRKNEKE